MRDETLNGTGASARRHHAGGNAPAPEPQRRMSTKGKKSAVLRLLKGEPIELVSRELDVPAADLAAWRDAFLAGGEASLKTQPARDRNAEIARLKSKVGDVAIANMLLEAKIAKVESGCRLDRRRSRR